jgi:hypothetical protein
VPRPEDKLISNYHTNANYEHTGIIVRDSPDPALPVSSKAFLNQNKNKA